MFTDKELEDLLRSLITSKENEIVEFKSATNSFDIEDIGKYFSALSNEANLCKVPYAWLIFGVDNKGIVKGTIFRNSKTSLHSLFQQH